MAIDIACYKCNITNSVIYPMIGIGRHTDYAARVVLHLAGVEDGTLVPIAEVAAKRLLPQPFVRRVVGKLVTAEIVETQRGAGGGIRLAKPASTISLLNVVNAVEGKIVLNRCVDSPQACPLTKTCPVQRTWTGATRLLEDYLENVRFDQLSSQLEMKITETGYPKEAST